MNIKSIFTHKTSILSVLLMVAAAVLGADGSFAMAVEPVELAGPANPSLDINDRQSVPNVQAIPGVPTADSKGFETQLQGKSATATDVRDAGLEAEDIDPKVAKFRPFRFPIEWYIANKCQQVKSNSYVHSHYRTGATILEGETKAVLTVNKTTKTVTFNSTQVENFESFTEYSEVFATGVKGFSASGVEDGDLALFITAVDDIKGEATAVALNPDPDNNTTIPQGTNLVIGATACSESQMRVAPETYLPEKEELYLQKKIANVIITDEWKEQAKKVPFITADVLHNGLYNFKRKCARTHWLGRKGRIDVKVKELNGNREATYFEKGILRQIPMLYSWDGDFGWDDLMALTKLQFAKNSENNYAVAFCGQNTIEAIEKLIYSTSAAQRGLKFEDVSEMGINFHRWHDVFGTLELVHDPTLDDIGYQDFIAIIDIQNAVRYYKRNEKQSTQDMKKTGEAREAEVTMISMIDCIGLKGYNAVLACPASKIAKANNLGGITKTLISAATVSDADTTKLIYLTANDPDSGFSKGTIVEYKDNAWVEFTGVISA